MLFILVLSIDPDTGDNGKWREANGYDDGAFYVDGSKRTLLDESLTETQDHADLIEGSDLATRRQLLLDNQDLPNLTNDMAYKGVIRNWDWFTNKNTAWYKDVNNRNRWSIRPWDIDSTMGRAPFDAFMSPYDRKAYGLQGADREPWTTLYDQSDLREMYLRRFRTLLDQWYGGSNEYLSRYLEDFEEAEDEINLEYDNFNGFVDLQDPESSKTEASELLERMAKYYLVRRQVDWAIPPAQSANPVAQIDDISYGGLVADEFITFANTTDESIDLTGWQIDEINFTFPSGSVILPGQTVYVVRDDVEYRAAHSGTIVLGQFTTNLADVSAGSLTLRRANDSISDSANL